ncbi:DUF2147 domain-containing protein [Undibacterium sp.]|uniref:DUF2147 domain-containing protein n=1 Tax=Undibacterium sp. TaxID=1914977 RepID=UPI002CF6448D|nr:DUF2147 domain-containing protein [Undibacterium sp.]HTD02492.1 DUF2147 domain-containing protein [Undibacterium sp.]
MNVNKSIAVLAVSLASFPWFAGTASATDFTAAKTRAEVIAELKQARAEGSYIVGGEEYPGQSLARKQTAQTAQTAPTAQATPQSGVWLTQSGNLEVEIAACGPALCGSVVRVLGNQAMSGNDAGEMAADSRPAQGLTILRDFTPTNGREWKGHIYNRGNGETYDCLMSLQAPDQLQLRIYKGDPQSGMTQVWTRVAAAADASPAQALSKAAP